MNRKGSVMIYTMMIALIIIILALALSPGVTEIISIARNNVTVQEPTNITGMDCGNSSIDNFLKAACIATDLTSFYFIAAVIFIGGALIGARVVFGGE